MDRRGFLKGLFATAAVLRMKSVVQLLPKATGFAAPFNGELMRSKLWNAQIKELLLDELNSMKFTKILE